MRLPMITLEDENDFQWLAIGAVGMLLIVVLILLVSTLRKWRAMERRADQMEATESRARHLRGRR